MVCSPPGSSVHGTFQPRILERLPFPSPGIFPTQGSNPGLLHCRQILYHQSHQGSPRDRILSLSQNWPMLSQNPASWWFQSVFFKEGWAPKYWRSWTVVLEKTLESPLNSKEIKLVNPKRNQPWTFIGRTDEADAIILWPPDAKTWSTGKDPDAGKDWGQEKGWQRMRQLNGVTDTMDMTLSRFQEIVKDWEAWRAAVHGVTKSQTRLSYWTTAVLGQARPEHHPWIRSSPLPRDLGSGYSFWGPPAQMEVWRCQDLSQGHPDQEWWGWNLNQKSYSWVHPAAQITILYFNGFAACKLRTNPVPATRWLCYLGPRIRYIWVSVSKLQMSMRLSWLWRWNEREGLAAGRGSIPPSALRLATHTVVSRSHWSRIRWDGLGCVGGEVPGWRCISLTRGCIFQKRNVIWRDPSCV